MVHALKSSIFSGAIQQQEYHKPSSSAPKFSFDHAVAQISEAHHSTEIYKHYDNSD